MRQCLHAAAILKAKCKRCEAHMQLTQCTYAFRGHVHAHGERLGCEEHFDQTSREQHFHHLQRGPMVLSVSAHMPEGSILQGSKHFSRGKTQTGIFHRLRAHLLDDGQQPAVVHTDAAREVPSHALHLRQGAVRTWKRQVHGSQVNTRINGRQQAQAQGQGSWPGDLLYLSAWTQRAQ